VKHWQTLIKAYAKNETQTAIKVFSAKQEQLLMQ
jgi:hypothetical protein